VEIDTDYEVTITMTPTVPLAIETCNELYFQHDDMSGVFKSGCAVHFNDELGQMPERLEHTLKLRVKPDPGCDSYTSLLQFHPYNKPGSHTTIWANYAPSNITVRL